MTTGQFKLKYTENAVGEYKKGDTVERDNLTVRVKVTVEDAAGKTDQLLPDGDDDDKVTPLFDLLRWIPRNQNLRSRIPIVPIIASRRRFRRTYNFIGEDEDPIQDLNPLVFTSDEPLDLGTSYRSLLVMIRSRSKQEG